LSSEYGQDSAAGVFRDGIYDPSLRPDAPISEMCTNGQGEGLFTTALVHRNTIVHPEHHEARLVHDSNLLKKDWARAIQSLVREMRQRAERWALAHPGSQGMIRGVLEARKGSPTKPSQIVSICRSKREPLYNSSLLVTLNVQHDPRKAPWIKSTDRGWTQELQAEGDPPNRDGTVLLGPEGVREGDYFHIFIRTREKQWLTAPLGIGVIFGTTRSHILSLLRARGELVSESFFQLNDLLNADIALCVSSLRGIARIGSIQGKPLRLDCVLPSWLSESLRS
jgi:branched-subunit amino acid aminotransferase/4-amino-4-deoxychorismate lyase